MYEQRRLQFVSKMKENNVDVAIINSDTNIYYFTGYYSNPRERLTALFIFPNGDSKLLVPSLNRQSAEIASVGTLLDYKDNENPFTLIEELIDRRYSHIALEENSWSTARYKMLSSLLPDMKSVDATEWIDQIRKIKTADEVDKMKQAIALTEKGLEYGISLLSQDLTEQEVALEIEYKVKQLGAEKLAFDVKVISGQHSALPHGKPRKEKIQSNAFVLFDMGVSFEGYNADISRTVVLGEATEEMERIYTTVREALELAMKEIKPGVTIGDLDRTAREYIKDCGYGSYFIHRLGHGLGLELHEYPSIHESNEKTLEKGMVFTVEPGIYIPHIGGVRIEENVLVTEDGFELLTNLPKHLQVIERT